MSLSKKLVMVTLSLVSALHVERARALIRSPEPEGFLVWIQRAEDSKRPVTERWRAIWSVAKSDHPKTYSQLLSWTQSKEWLLRHGALMGLNKIDPERASEAARKLLKDPSLLVRSMAIEVVSRNLKMEHRRDLWQVLQDPKSYRKGQSLWIRSQVLSILVMNPQKSEMNRFEELKSDRDEKVAGLANRGLLAFRN